MFGTSLLEHRKKPARLTDQAWESLLSTMNSAGGSARSTAMDAARSAMKGASHLGDGASGLMSSASDEARQRATAALAALGGRRPGRPWTMLVVTGLAGAAIGWAVGMITRTTMSHDHESHKTGHMELIDASRPNSSSSMSS